MPGWRRALIPTLLDEAGLPPDPDVVCPAIPGILRASRAAKSRSGIALRLDTASGAGRELTTAVALPQPLRAPADTARRVRDWIAAQGWADTPYAVVSDPLLPAWVANPARVGRLHRLY